MLKPVKRLSVPMSISEQVKDLIAKHKLQPGDRLPSERQLAEDLQVSRPALRESLQALSSLGLIEIRQGEGAFVARNSLTTLRSLDLFSLVLTDVRVSLLEARLILEPRVAALAAARATHSQIEALARTVKEMEECVISGKSWSEPDLLFHLTLVESTHNLVLISLINSLGNLLIQIPRTASKAVAYHRQIYEAVKRQDDVMASELMVKHLSDIQQDLTQDLTEAIIKERAQNSSSLSGERGEA